MQVHISLSVLKQASPARQPQSAMLGVSKLLLEASSRRCKQGCTSGSSGSLTKGIQSALCPVASCAFAMLPAVSVTSGQRSKCKASDLCFKQGLSADRRWHSKRLFMQRRTTPFCFRLLMTSHLQATMALDLPRCHLTSTGGMRQPRRRWLPESRWRLLWQRGCLLTRRC